MQLSTCILVQFVSCPATDLHHRLLPQSGKQRLACADRHLPRFINRGNFRNRQSVTCHDITAALTNPVEELRKFPISIRCRNRLLHIHFPCSKKCSDIAYSILNVLLPQKSIGSYPFHFAFTSRPLAVTNSIFRILEPISAARIKGPSPPCRHIRSVVDHPLGHCQPRSRRRLPQYPALGHQGEGAVFLLAKRSAMQLGIARHQSFREIRIVRVDGLLQPGCFMREGLERFHVGLETWP